MMMRMKETRVEVGLKGTKLNRAGQGSQKVP